MNKDKTDSTEKDETGWLIEHSGRMIGAQTGYVSWLCVGYTHSSVGELAFTYTHDASKALRLSRKQDAEAILALHLGKAPSKWYSEPYSVTEHMWLVSDKVSP